MSKDFYETWVGYWDEWEPLRASSRRVIHEDEWEFIRTRQDAATTELISPRMGFATAGTVTMLSEIPTGWKTGKHSHGEEAIYIVSGSGCTVMEGRRYDWSEGSSLLMPFGAVHQHFNLGPEPAQYVSCMTPEFEHAVGVHRTLHLEDCGPISGNELESLESHTHDEYGKRVVLPLEDAIDVDSKKDDVASRPPLPTSKDKPLVLDGISQMSTYGTSHHARVLRFMRIGTDQNDFDPKTVEISGLMMEEPGTASGDHAHMEAHLYVLEGEGYTVVDGVKYPWRKGSAVQIPGPQSQHQHFNTGESYSKTLRIAFASRYVFESTAKRTFPYLYFSGKRDMTEEDYQLE